MVQTTRLSKVISLVLACFFAVQYFVPDTTSYLALVPGRTLPCVWNLITAGFVTQSPIELCINIVAVLALARLVEPIYGSKEFLKYLLVVDFAVLFSVFVAVYISFAVAANGALLYTEFMGFQGILAALLVAVKQIMPHHEVKLFNVVKLRVMYLPSLVLLAVAGLSVTVDRYDYLSFWLLGTYQGWLYLRFFQQQPESNFHGDASDDFKFSSFFPAFLSTPIDLVAGLFSLIFRLRHTPGAAEAAAAAKPLHASGTPSALGSDSVDANRRRERGAKALEERLGLKAQQQQQQQQADVDVERGGAEATPGPAVRTAQTYYNSSA